MRKEIRSAIKRDYHTMKGRGGYDAVGLIWGVSGGMAWQFVNEEYFWPTDENIEKIVLLVAQSIGIRIGNRGGKDLWAMSPEELLWRLENREEL